jgi:2-amino-4-hydroxy-6-hydroxymethyldihydropteridine diphosphokinase
MTLCHIGIGSNLDNPEAQVRNALLLLACLPDSKLLSHSSLYRSAPIGPKDQPDFINAVAALETGLTPLMLLDALQTLEQQSGRIRKRIWGERSLDLDLLLYGDNTLSLPRLIVPHREMTHRAFVLVPLAEIAPDLVLPDGTPIASLLPQVANQSIRRLG